MNTKNLIENIGSIEIKKRDDGSFFPPQIELQCKDFDLKKTFRLKSPSLNFVLFYVPWCPHCQKIKEMWSELSKKEKNVKIKALNCESNKSHVNRMNVDYYSLMKKNFIQSYPTLILYKDTLPFEAYEGERTLPNLLKFCKKFK